MERREKFEKIGRDTCIVQLLSLGHHLFGNYVEGTDIIFGPMAKALALETLGARLVDESTGSSLPVRPCQAEEMLVWLLHLGLWG